MMGLVIRSNFTSNTHENGYMNTVYNMLAALVIARRSKKKHITPTAFRVVHIAPD